MWFKKPRPLALSGGIVFTYVEPCRNEEEMIRAWLEIYPAHPFITPDGSKLYILFEGRMIRYIGPNFNELTKEEINYILENARPVNPPKVE